MTIIRTALEHHRDFDGKGYPDLSEHGSVDFLSQIVGLADFASWATVSEAYYHKPIPPHRLVRTLISRAGTQFDPLFVKVFLPFLGLYPAGTLVRLNSGEKAIVIEPNIRNISRPRVAIQNRDGSSSPLWLVSLNKNNSGSPYQQSIRGLIGNTSNTELYFDLINNEPETQR
jgi:hypothetical protein